MATTARQPFAPLDGSRLQNLTSLKNRQNAIPSPAAGKRKAELIDTDDSENVDPTFFAKRAKGSSSSTPAKDIFKPSAFVLKAAPPLVSTPEVRSYASPTKPASSSRRTLHPRSPVARLSSGITKSSPIYAPAGRSPTRSKRNGLLSNRRRTVGPYARVDPPSFSAGSAAPFSLDAALKGTIPGYGSSRPAPKPPSNPLVEDDMKASWFFEIHEDTPEQEMTNLLQHSTCTLDISSDEESERKASRERAEGRDKENIPPADDVSQTSARRSARLGADDMVIEKERVALGEMNTADYYPAGCDETSVIIIPADEEEQPEKAEAAPMTKNVALAPEPKTVEPAVDPVAEIEQDIDALISKPTEGSSKAAVLEPMEGTGDSFELWESGSAKDDTEAAVSASS
ncbi:hypothetical protein QQX98_002873 [Neonectria punicea]|uniref:Thymidylate kinase n=1 Tax=Neonectria punicea TaxID=979145 RepID=A0ABR1HGF9_9HYPO